MTSQVRWEWLATRLLAVVVLLLAVQYVLGLLVRSATTRSLQAAIGAQVDAEHARVSLVDAGVELHGLQIADPRQPMRNLLQADYCALDVAVNGLLHKRTIIDRAQLTGLKFGTPRQTSGELAKSKPSTPSPTIQWIRDQSAQAVHAWFTRLEQQFTRDLVSQLESVRLTEELVARWPEQYRALKERVEELQDRGEKLRRNVRTAQENPLRHADILRQLPTEVSTLREEAAAIAAEINELPQIIDADRRAIIAARKHDEQLIRDALRIEPVDSIALSAYLLHEHWNGPLGELLSWLWWTRELIEPDLELPDAPRGRGEDVLFAGCHRSPNFLIRTIDLAGAASINGQTIDVRGMLMNLSSHPALCDEPLRFTLVSKDASLLKLQATLDRTYGAARDELLVDCQRLPMPAVKIGRSDELCLSLSPSSADVNLSFRMEGDKLTGDVQLVHKDVSITSRLAGPLGDVPLQASLRETLGRIDCVALRLSLSGTLDNPQCGLWSNLGPAVAESMDTALRQAAELHAAALLKKSQQHIDEQFASLERQLAEQQTALLDSLKLSSALLKQLASQQTVPDRLPAELGRRLPTGSLFR